MPRIARTLALFLPFVFTTSLLTPSLLADEPWDKPFSDPKAILDAAAAVPAHSPRLEPRRGATVAILLRR